MAINRTSMGIWISCLAWISCCLVPTLAFSQQPKAELKKISNDQITIGLKPESGGAIAWVSAGPGSENLVNSFDRGRLIQQSYYGKADGSKWDKQDWHWNPVQGGDWRGSSAQLLELTIDGTTAYAKTLPKHWASGQDITTATMEQWIDLDGPVAHIKYRFTQKGGEDHPPVHQELPAVFMRASLRNLILYDGDKPWSNDLVKRTVPGWPNQYHKLTEHWAAYVDDKDRGLGVYVPVASDLTCYRFGHDVPSNESACSYFAPISTFAIAADFVWQYDVYLTVGTATEIRERFKQLAAKPAEAKQVDAKQADAKPKVETRP